jgi:UDP-N-acetylglucosamine--N-acetylmuramyl-(pentapeptide) pyrophosphoryl-undecaprenol N-acetylglucosamine transferase
MESAIVARTGLPYRAVEAASIRGATPWELGRNMGKLFNGYRQAQALLGEWHADVALVTGGYVSVPVALAAWRHSVPVMIYLPDREPGWAVRFLGRFAERIAISFQEFRKSLPDAYQHKVWVSGYPVRAALLDADRASGYGVLDLDPSRQTLLVLGGSRGARPLNRALVPVLPELLSCYQVVHVTGQTDWPWAVESRDALPEQIRVHYRVYPYLHEELVAAMAVADLVVARAGAATMAEFPAVGLPSILVPYPYAGEHQRLNADFMVAHGAAVRIDQEDLEQQLEPTVKRLLEDRGTLKQMSERARALSVPDAAHRLAAEMRRLARDGGREA